MRLPSRISPSVKRKLGHYVYLYVNPLDESVFYVGKGRRSRALAHLKADDKRAIMKIIKEIQGAGEEPRIEILAHGLRNEDTALRIEAAAIDLLGLSNLANVVRGHGAKFGRMPLEEVVAHYTLHKANIREPSILIRINKLYRYGMTDAELYDATRSAWRVGERRRKQVKLAFSVFEGVVREVYRVSDWLRGGSTFNYRSGGRLAKRPQRWEFVGVIAEDRVRKRYMNRHVGHLLPKGSQNPISYVNID